MELRHLRYFLAVAEELNFRKAAERLYITQPPLTRQIQELEHELGTELFERVGKRVILTEAGHYLMSEARKMLDHADEIKRHSRSIREGEEERLRLGFVESALEAFVPEVVARMKQQTPALRFELFEMPTEAQVAALLNDRLDAGIVRHWGQVEDLDFTKLLEEHLVAICPVRLFGDDAPLGLEDFERLPFIAFSRTKAPGLVSRIDTVFGEHGFQPRITFDNGQLAIIPKLLLAGLGWAILPHYTIPPPCWTDRFHRITVSSSSAPMEIGIAAKKGRERGPVTALIEACRAVIGQGQGPGGKPRR